MASGPGRGSMRSSTTKPVRAEETDPLAVGQLVDDDVAVVELVHPEVVVVQRRLDGVLALRVLRDERDRARVAEREQPVPAQQPRRLRNQLVRVGERKCPVVAEHDVEAFVRQRHVLGRRVDERELDPYLRHQSSPVLELARRVVEPDGPRTLFREQDRPLRGAAAELEHVLAVHVAEDVQLGLGDLPDTPAWLGPVDELTVPLLVLVALAVPVCPVTKCLLRRLFGQPRSPRRASGEPNRPGRSRSTRGRSRTRARAARGAPRRRTPCRAGCGSSRRGRGGS